MSDPATFAINPLYARPGEATEGPKLALADDSMRPEAANQLMRDETMLDGTARLNLATFVGTRVDMGPSTKRHCSTKS
jgi:glutamate decarboxylase